MTRPDVAISGARSYAYRIPTDSRVPETDATLAWDSTTVVVVEVEAGGATGVGYTYGTAAIAALVDDELAPVIVGADAMDGASAWSAMGEAVRNVGRPGVGMMAVSAVDVALWDLKGRLLGLSVVDLMGRARADVDVYGSGGFTSYPIERLARQVGGWVEEGIARVKVKTSRDPTSDPVRLDAVRKAIGDETELYVDANGALTPKQALYWARRFRQEWDVSWFEEPVSSADFEGLRLVRERGPDGMDIAAGEYGFVLADFRNLLDNGCVDCLQADVTRCGGFTGFQRVAALCEARSLDVSSHTAPTVSAHALCASMRPRHAEYFHDHVRVEGIVFEGRLTHERGRLRPDTARPGLGIVLKREDAARFRVA